MNKKIIIPIVIVIIAIMGLYAFYIHEEFPESTGNTTLNVSSEGPYNLSDIIDDIKTHEYYEGYDNKTVEWMESLGDKYVWSSAGTFVIMDKGDSDKIPSAYVDDAWFNEIFSCNVIEKHSLGDVKYPRDVYLVNNVKYIKEEVHSLQE